MSWKTEFTAEEKNALADKRTVPRLLSFPLGALGMYCLGEGLLGSDPLVLIALTAFTCAMMFCWTSVFHEAAHQTLWPSQTFSILSGRIIGTLLFVPYSVYRQVHIRHHAFLNRPDDWELWPYSDPKASLSFRRRFVWIDLLCGIVTGPYIYGRLFFHRDSPLRDSRIRRAIRLEYVTIVVFWASVWGLTTVQGIWPNHIRAILVPMWITGMLQTGRKLTEHLGMESFDPILGTRTVLPRKWLIRLSSFLNFDIFIHGPHHRHPRAAHTQLETKMDEYRTRNGQSHYPVYYRYWHAVRAMIPWLLRNPGCGTNVVPIAPVPTRSDTDDFASDEATAAVTKTNTTAATSVAD